MRIGILADTHIRRGQSLPRFVLTALADTDMILHAGDITTGSVLEELSLLAEVIAVKGNGDWTINNLPDKTIVSAGNIRIGLTHGYLGQGKSTPEIAYNTFKKDRVDLIVFGHSHIPYKSYYNGVLLFNPGSPTEKRRQPNYSLGIMTIEEDIFDIQHLFFKKQEES